MMKRSLVLALLLVGSLAVGEPRPKRDVDVAVPPGTPLEWMRSIPCPTPRGGSAIPTGGSQKPVAGGTVVVPTSVNVKLPSTFGFVRVLTWDLTGEVPWTPRKSKVGVATGGRVDYPPEVSDAAYWMTLSVFLRRFLHPGMTSESEARVHLIELGEIGLPALSAAEDEPSLKKFVEALRKDLGELPAKPPAAPESADPDESMLLKFASYELATGYPYDPELRFAPRLYVLGDDGFDVVKRCAASPHSLLRRNAVAALGQYASPGVAETALDLFVKSDDPVVRARAIGILGRRSHRPAAKVFVDRLATGKEDLFDVGIIHALGLIGDSSAAPAIVAYARRHADDADVIWAAVPALARLRSDEPAVLKYLKEIKNTADGSTRKWDKGLAQNARPDRPDPEGAKGQVIFQMALLALSMCDRDKGGDAKAETARIVLKAAQDQEDPDPRFPDSYYTIGKFHAPVQFLLLEALAALNDDGRKFLKSLVETNSPGADVSLRTYGLELLARDEAMKIARVWTANASNCPDTLKVYGLEYLDRVKSPDAEKTAHEVLERTAAAIDASSPPVVKYQAAAAARILGDRGKGDVALLKKILERCGLLGAKANEKSTAAKFKESLDALMNAAEHSPKDVDKRLDEMVDWAIDAKVNSRITKKTRKESRDAIANQIKALKPYEGTAFYGAMVDNTKTWIRRFVLREEEAGGGSPFGRGEPFAYDPQVPLASTLILELGRTKEKAALDLLLPIVRDEKHPARAEACLALGAAGFPEAAADLVKALEAGDGFVRYCAYRALRPLTGVNAVADWIGGSASELKPAIQKYREWVDAHK